MSRLRRDDRGTSLVIVLMIITFVSVVMGVVLAQEGTSIKTTDALQDQGAISYGADAAGKAAVTQLENSKFGAADPTCSSGATSTLNLGDGSNPFYRPVSPTSEPLNVVATCMPDTTPPGATTIATGNRTMVGYTAANLPGAAIESVGTTAADGVAALNLFRLCVQGSVLSYTTITGPVAAGTSSSGSPTACPDTPNPAVTVKAYSNPLLSPVLTGCPLLSPLTFSPTPCTAVSTSAPTVPIVPDPSTATTQPTNPATVCQPVSGGKTYAAFVPGLYTVATASNAWSLSTPCKISGRWAAPDLEWFSPGVYYFNFPSSTTWTLPAAVVGGTPAIAADSGTPITGLNPAVASTLSALGQMTSGEGKCVPPTKQVQTGQGGVEFVFGGSSTMTGMSPTILSLFTASTDMDLCATYSKTGPPVAIYGAYQQPVTVGGTQLPVESGCVAAPGCILGTKSLLNWPSSANQTFHIDGYVWAPAAAMTLSYLGSSGQAFNWGVLVRTFQLYGLSLPALTMASLPASNPGPVITYNYTVRYLNVWTCTASASPCAQSGPPDVQIKLQQTPTKWVVLSWSEQRPTK